MTIDEISSEISKELREKKIIKIKEGYTIKGVDINSESKKGFPNWRELEFEDFYSCGMM